MQDVLLIFLVTCLSPSVDIAWAETVARRFQVGEEGGCWRTLCRSRENVGWSCPDLAGSPASSFGCWMTFQASGSSCVKWV